MFIVKKHYLYPAWKSMISRCYHKTHPSYEAYGGRGIFVCDQWRGPGGFRTFFADMGDRPAECTLERVDNDGGYTPENCIWADRKAQQRNRRMTVYATIEGNRYLVVELAEKYGLKPDTIKHRAQQGMSFEDVVRQEKLVYKPGLALGGKASGAAKRLQTHCKNGHEFSATNTYTTKEGWRSCRKCHAIRENLRRRRVA